MDLQNNAGLALEHSTPKSYQNKNNGSFAQAIPRRYMANTLGASLRICSISPEISDCMIKP
nr:hypothetical protein [Marinobacter sp. AC-23]